MQDLLKKIEADADVCLSQARKGHADFESIQIRAFLKRGMHRLKLTHRSGASGAAICQARAVILDHIIRYLWKTALIKLLPHVSKGFPPIAVVALGGYGRSELNPQSDIELLFVHEGQVSPTLRASPMLERIVTCIGLPLSDLGFRLNQSVRSIAECIAAANHRADQRSMEIRTSFVEARLLVGSKELFQHFQTMVLERCVNGSEPKYIAACLEHQAVRRAKFGNSASIQEPNVKNGCGGLRDYQNLIWMAFFKYRTRSLAELQAMEFLTFNESALLDNAYDFLLRTRNELHYANRASDVLAKHIQSTIALNLGYSGRSPSGRIEKFMHDYYTHARNLYLITTTLGQRLALVPPPPSRLELLGSFLKRKTEPLVVDGCRFEYGYILPSSPRMFRDQPRRLMRAFLHMQQRGLKLHPDLAQLIRNQLSLVDRDFLADEHVRETFLAILDQRGNVAWVLRAMHEVGLLGRYLPEFGKLTCLVQHEFYHQYTADEHTLVCLQRLDEIWASKDSSQQSYAQIFQNIERPFVLYLALLLHDTGKAAGDGHHIVAGVRLARRAAKRLGLDAPTSQLLSLLIEQHVVLPQVSQRRDLEDPTVIRAVASKVRSVEALNLLTLLTLGDALGTSDKLWNGFKDSLLWSLYNKTMRVLGAGTEFIQSEERQREQLLAAVRDEMSSRISEEELQAHFASLPQHYFHTQSAREVREDVFLVHRLLKLQSVGRRNSPKPIVSWRSEAGHGCTNVNICARTHAQLFSKIVGCLGVTGLSVLSAQSFLRSDDITLASFQVNNASTGNCAWDDQRDKFETLFDEVMSGTAVDLYGLFAQQKQALPHYQAYEGERMPTRIAFYNEVSDSRSLIEIETEDQIGLIYIIAETMADLQLDISSVRICTEKGAAIDSLYIHEIGGGRVLSADRQKQIDRRLREAINRSAKPV